jgi:hypothetical protein
MEVSGQLNHPYLFVSGETAPTTQWIEGCVGFWIDGNALETRQVGYPCLESNNAECWAMKYEQKYRSFATRVSQLKIWHFWVTGIERNVCRCTFNRYSVVRQFAKLTPGEQICRRYTHRKLYHFKTFKRPSWTITDFELWHFCHKCAIWANACSHTHTRLHTYTPWNNTLTVLRATELYGSLLWPSDKFSIRSCTGFGVRSSLVNPAHYRTEWWGDVMFD